jgi:hypothetical protein
MIMIFLVKSGYCQQTELKKEQRMEELIESLEVTDEATSEGSLLLEDLSYYATHPILINKATEEELSRLNLLNFRQVRSILNYREKYGQILTIKELSVLGEFSGELLQKIEPFFLFAQERDSLDLSREKVVRQLFLARIKGSLPTPVGYSSSNGKPAAYGGTPFGYFSRYRCEVGKWLDIGITTENDAGEEFFRKSNKFGFDFLSGFVCWNGEGVVRKVVAGDYHLRFGQGVSLWSGGGVSYVSDLSSMMRTGEGIRPYSSTDENRFFRGAAVQFDFKPVKLSLFFSSREKDANLTSDSIAGDSITSFRMDGLHRTISELSDEKNVNERMIGGYGDFRFNRWRFGLLVSYLKFGLPVSNGDSPYKSKTFEGDVNLNFGLDYHLILNEINFFGEAGLSQNGKPAFVNGVVWKAHPQLSLSMLYRYYDPAFQSFNSGAFAEGSGGRNEKGIFVAFEYCPVSKVKIGAQADLFYFPWLTFQTITPAQGRIYTFRFEVAIRKNLSAYVQTRYTNKPQKTSGTTGVPEQWEEITSKWRAHLDWKVSERLQFRSRVEKVGYQYNSNSENGYLLFQDAIFTASDKLKCWLRVAYYNTDGYNSRVYSYENDLLYYFAIPEFHGIGMRSYLNLKWQPSKNLVVYGKAGYTFREGETSMGSGNDASPGNRKFDFRSQICLKF